MALTNKLSAIGNAIREKTGKTDLLTLDQMPEEIKGIETGSGSVDYMPYVKSITFSNAISEITDDIYLDLSNATSISGLIDQLNINFSKLTIKVNKCTSFQHIFRAFGATIDNLKEIEIIGDTSNVTTFYRMCQNRKALEKLTGEIDFSGAVGNKTYLDQTFIGCGNLKSFTPKAKTIKLSISINSSPYLTEESIQAIINGLADLTGATAQTLTFHATVKAKLTETQIASITSKNWTLA